MQYPETEVPPWELHKLVCSQTPEPMEVVHLLLVQHFISLDPGQRLEVVVPLQHPAEILTQTPETPPALQVAEYEQLPKVEFRYFASTPISSATTQISDVKMNIHKIRNKKVILK